MPQLLRVTAIAEAFPEGQKTTAFVMEYDCEVDLTGHCAESFAVLDRSLEPQIPAAARKIVRIYTNAKPNRAKEGSRGRYVILETDLSQKEAYAILPYNSAGEPDPFGPGPMCYQRPNASSGKPEPPKPGGGPSPQMHYCGPKPLQLMVSQKEPLRTANGEIIPASDAPCTQAIYPDVDRFQLFLMRSALPFIPPESRWFLPN